MTRRADQRSTRGYFGIVAFDPKKETNVGGILRSAYAFGAAFAGTIGRRYERQASDTVAAPRHLPVYTWESADAMFDALPQGCSAVGVEFINGARLLPGFIHPTSAVYILGPEDGSLPTDVLNRCDHVIRIPTKRCLNLASAATVVMYDRVAKRHQAALELDAAGARVGSGR